MQHVAASHGGGWNQSGAGHATPKTVKTAMKMFVEMIEDDVKDRRNASYRGQTSNLGNVLGISQQPLFQKSYLCNH